MRIYFSGIGGTALAPLSNLALDAGYQVIGSDRQLNRNTEQLTKRGVQISTDQTGEFLKQAHDHQPIDWLIYTSALPADHPELVMSNKLGIKTTKRDQFIPWFIQKQQFKLIAVAGAHGKTSTTTMLIWLFRESGIPASHLVGSNLTFDNAGRFTPGSRYFIYECDEYDRNFLHYQPDFSLIPVVDYDHIDIYPTIKSYQQAFLQFFQQSKQVFLWEKDVFPGVEQLKNIQFVTAIDPRLRLLGQHNRANAQLILELLPKLHQESLQVDKAIEILNRSPRAERRFELLQPKLISDYAHHPVEITATLELAQEYAKQNHYKRVIAIYEPHQNDRQVQFQDDYPKAFRQADQVHWLPTYVARDHHEQILSISELTQNIPQAVAADFNQDLITTIRKHLSQNELVVLMSAGKLDGFIRQRLNQLTD